MKQKRTFLALLLAAALSLGLLAAPVSAAYAPSYDVDTTITDDQLNRKTQAAKGFAIASGVLQGDEKGNLNWDNTLTRAQAATMIIRLMGMEDEAKAAMNQPSPFTDVPAWANGYINVAYQEQIVKGVTDDRFSPNTPCRIQDFITMLYRLTNLTENQDYSWSTAAADFIEDTRAIESYKSMSGWYPSRIMFRVCADQMETYFKNNGAFTREVACDVVYFMLDIKAGPDDESLADLLAENYGMSDMVLYNHYVRRTAYNMRNDTSVTFNNYSGSVPTVLSVKDGKLYVEDSHKSEIYITLPSGERVSLGSPVTLPKEGFSTTLSYQEKFLAGYDEDGDPLYGGRGHEVDFTVTCKDGKWSLYKGKSGAEAPDYAYVYACRSEEHFTELSKLEGNLKPTPEIQALADKLTAGKTTELSKADAICEWVATHIYYDYPTYRTSSKDFWYKQLPEVVLETRLAVCQGFSQLTYVLLKAAGIECYDESGSVSTGWSHGWNVARLDGKWVVMDNTWDSPLEYEKTAGSGYQCRYDEPGLIWVWRTPDNIMEPGASRRDVQLGKVYFNMDYEKFYSEHKLYHTPQFANRTVLNINSVK